MFVYNPENPEKAYFKSSGKIKHHKDCHTEVHHFSRNVYDEQLFSYPEALKMLEKPSTNNTSKKIGNEIKKEDTNNLKPLSTLNQIYTMCKNIHPNETYNGFFSRDILADTRTYDIYKNEINGYKIVECNFYRFEKNLIIMNYPCYPTQKEIHHISLYLKEKYFYKKNLVVKTIAAAKLNAAILLNFSLPFVLPLFFLLLYCLPADIAVGTPTFLNM